MQYEQIQPELSELLSAYLDGEVTVEEQESIERRLHTNAEFRQLYDELRAVQAGLESLPRLRLEKNFAATVLRRAERATLSAAISADTETRTAKERVSLPEPSMHSRHLPDGSRRPPLLPRYLQWSIPAMATALLFMIFNPFVNRDGQPSGAGKPPAVADAGVTGALAPIKDAISTRLADAKKGTSSEIGESGTSLKPQVDNPRARTASVPFGPGRSSLAAELEKATIADAISATPHLLVVECDVTAEALRSGAFEKLLAEHQMSLTPGASQLRLDVSTAADSQATERGIAVTADGFLVEASPAQIDATVASLKSTPNQFPSIAVQTVALSVTGMPSYDSDATSEPHGAAMRVVVADHEQLRQLIPVTAVASAPPVVRSGNPSETPIKSNPSRITAVLDTGVSQGRPSSDVVKSGVSDAAPSGSARALFVFRVVSEPETTQ